MRKNFWHESRRSRGRTKRPSSPPNPRSYRPPPPDPQEELEELLDQEADEAADVLLEGSGTAHPHPDTLRGDRERGRTRWPYDRPDSGT